MQTPLFEGIIDNTDPNSSHLISIPADPRALSTTPTQISSHPCYLPYYDGVCSNVQSPTGQENSERTLGPPNGSLLRVSHRLPDSITQLHLSFTSNPSLHLISIPSLSSLHLHLNSTAVPSLSTTPSHRVPIQPDHTLELYTRSQPRSH